MSEEQEVKREYEARRRIVNMRRKKMREIGGKPQPLMPPFEETYRYKILKEYENN